MFEDKMLSIFRRDTDTQGKTQWDAGNMLQSLHFYVLMEETKGGQRLWGFLQE